MRRCTMSKKKDPKLYELILDWTQSGNLLWKRLDDEETNDPFVKRATDDMNIDLIESFYTNISSGTIYVISDFGGDPALFVQPNGGAALTEFDVSTPQINQLKNAIKDQVDDVTEFIESLEKWSDFFISFKLLLLLEQQAQAQANFTNKIAAKMSDSSENLMLKKPHYNRVCKLLQTSHMRF